MTNQAQTDQENVPEVLIVIDEDCMCGKHCFGLHSMDDSPRQKDAYWFTKKDVLKMT